MKIDPHVHTKGISLCSRVNFRDMINEKKTAGYDAVILTNHCQPWYYEKQNRIFWLQEFFKEYEQARNYGKSCDFKVFLGIEVSISDPHWSDFLLYGTSENFFYSQKSFFDMNQKELFDYCNLHGVLMVQAHPFRDGHSPCDPQFMHGVEINLRPQDYAKREAVEEFALKNDLFITSGSDYHSVVQDEFGGMIVPDSVCDSLQFANHIKNSGETVVFYNDSLKKYTKR